MGVETFFHGCLNFEGKKERKLIECIVNYLGHARPTGRVVESLQH